MNTLISERISKLRSLMLEKNIDTYILTKFDPHQSECADVYYNLVSYFSGFTGSNGKLVVTKDNLYIFTDGRYYQQCELQTKQNGYTLMKESEKDSIPYLDFAFKETKINGVIGFAPEGFSVSALKDFLNKIKNKNISINCTDDIVSVVNVERSFKTTKKIFDLDVKYAGESRTQKIKKVQEQVKEHNATCYILSSLDDIAYTLNIRGFDVDYNTYFASYLIFEDDKTTLFVDEDKISDVKSILENDNISIKNYTDVFEYIENIKPNTKTLINIEKTSYQLYQKGSHLDFIEEKTDITSLMKACKSDLELKNIKNATTRDCVALLRSIRRIKENANILNELTVADILFEERQKDSLYIMESFCPICAYNGNAAMMHYSATDESFATLKNEGFLLIDSGGTYFDGTTDITRTISLGETTDEMKTDFTLVLKSHIKVAQVKFLKGATGSKIDAIAREPLWNVGRNYACGTGHGVAFVGPVHEGPHNMGFKDNGIPLEENMLITNEPGLYVDGKYGIRTENTVCVVPFMKTLDGEFCQFETLSFFPIDRYSIKKDMLTESELTWINQYHKKVFEKLSPYVTGADLEFLREETREL